VPAIVFLGPTLSRREAERCFDAVYHPPAARGDIYRALHDGFDRIVLIDGEFHGRPSVWQREILDVIFDGVEVHGASSMGALRAAELHHFGMIGHGRIFAWYRDGVLDGDDEVALIYGPEELGYPALSEPLVNIRATLAAAVPDILSSTESDRLVAHAKESYFPERSFAAVLAAAPLDRRERLARFVSQRRIDQKREDAVAALTAAAGPRRPAAPVLPARPSSIWWRRHRLAAEGAAAGPRTLSPARIGQNAGISADEIAGLRRELSEMFFVADWARAHEVAVDTADLTAQVARFPDASGLSSVQREAALRKRALVATALRLVGARTSTGDTQTSVRVIITEWAKQHGITRPGWVKGALVDWIVAVGPEHFGYIGWQFEVELAEALRLSGRSPTPRGQSSR
jgi:hypothetical protein